MTRPAAATGRRGFLQRAGATIATASAISIAGCPALPFGPGADAAYYHSTAVQLDVDYDAVMAAAREAGYTVEEPFYVGTTDPNSGVHPTDLPELDARFGPGYLVFGVTYFYTDTVFVEVWFHRKPERVRVSIFDDRTVMGEFEMTSLPPEAWLVDRLTTVLDVDADRARAAVTDLKAAINDGTDIPAVELEVDPTVGRAYDALRADATEVAVTVGYGDGWVTETFRRDGTRIAAFDVIVQSMEIRQRSGDARYTVKLDRLGGLTCTVELPPHAELPESEYRGTYRRMFSAVGLPPEAVDDLTFEYTPTVW